MGAGEVCYSYSLIVCVLRVWDDYFHAKKGKENQKNAKNKQGLQMKIKVQLTLLTLFSLSNKSK